MPRHNDRMDNRERFLEYVQLGHKDRAPFYRTRVKLTAGQILKLQATQEEIRLSGEKFPSISATALKVKINHKRKRKPKHRYVKSN